jgi:hypothetical protein
VKVSSLSNLKAKIKLNYPCKGKFKKRQKDCEGNKVGGVSHRKWLT